MSAKHSSTRNSSTTPGSSVGKLPGLSLISNRRLGAQLSALVALGLFSMVLSVSIGTSIIVNQSLTNRNSLSVVRKDSPRCDRLRCKAIVDVNRGGWHRLVFPMQSCLEQQSGRRIVGPSHRRS